MRYMIYGASTLSKFFEMVAVVYFGLCISGCDPESVGSNPTRHTIGSIVKLASCVSPKHVFQIRVLVGPPWRGCLIGKAPVLKTGEVNSPCEFKSCSLRRALRPTGGCRICTPTIAVQIC